MTRLGRLAAMSIAMVLLFAAQAGADQITGDITIDFDITPRHVMAYTGECTGGGMAGVVVRDGFKVALADVECPDKIGAAIKGPQLIIIAPDSTSRSIPSAFAVNTQYHVRVAVIGQNIYAAIPGVAELAWENAPVKANPTAWPKTFLKGILAEVTAFTVASVGAKPAAAPVP
ncbi:MAG: hypothetical protein WC889_19430, partial [Myxococcota bacterium]